MDCISSYSAQDPLSRLERDLSLQMQIVQAAHHLFREENISKQIKKRRKSAVLKEEKKMKELETALNECRLMAGHKLMPKASTTTTEGEPRASAALSILLNQNLLSFREWAWKPFGAAPYGQPKVSSSLTCLAPKEQLGSMSSRATGQALLGAGTECLHLL